MYVYDKMILAILSPMLGLTLLMLLAIGVFMSMVRSITITVLAVRTSKTDALSSGMHQVGVQAADVSDIKYAVMLTTITKQDYIQHIIVTAQEDPHKMLEDS